MSDIDDDDLFLYGEAENGTTPKAETSVPPAEPAPISVEEVLSATNGLVAQLEQKAANDAVDASDKDSLVGGDEDTPAPGTTEVDLNGAIEGQGVDDDMEGDGDGDEEEEEDSEDDVEFIMELPTRSVDFRKRPTTTAAAPPTRPPPQPAPSLTTEYTPRERGTISKLPPPAPQPSGSVLPSAPGIPVATSTPEAQAGQSTDSGPDPSTLPVAPAPPSHPSINPSLPGTLDGRSIFEFDMDALAEKPWRRPGSDISDWFNYGFDEISWEAYCYRRRETGELASMLKGHVLVCLSLVLTLRAILVLYLYSRGIYNTYTYQRDLRRTSQACPKSNSRLCQLKSEQWS